MRTRIIAVAIAAVLAVAGAVTLVVAVRSADQRATEGAELVAVYVVTTEVAAGTGADHLGGNVESQDIPRAYVAADAVTDLDDLNGLVAAVSLQPGEQLLESRFQSPEELASSGAHADVPDGLQEVAIAVDLQRIAGGSVGPGDKVGVFVSFDKDADTNATTRLLLDQVLVTSVASTVAQSDETQAQGLVLVTLALSATDAASVVYAAEFGHIWMSAQNDQTKPGAESASTNPAAVTP